jgi:3-deoxy-7-phosphoheptulonate synthase/chorismate mutase
VSETLERLRARVTDLDTQLLATVNARLETVRELVAHKRETGAPMIDPARERWLLDHLTAANAGPLSPAGVERLCAFVLELTKDEAFVG